MPDISSHIQWFQAKIGSYDKQKWETSVEQRILQGLENRPKREGNLRKELIDVDIVRGSAFSKSKPRHGIKSVIINGLKRVILFPFYYSHWCDHLTKKIVYGFLFYYAIQIIQVILYFIWSKSTEIMVEEILLPIALSLGLGVLHAHIVAPHTVKLRRQKTTISPIKISTLSGSPSWKTSLKPTPLLDYLNKKPPNTYNNIIEDNVNNLRCRLDSFNSDRSKKREIFFEPKIPLIEINSTKSDDNVNEIDENIINSNKPDYSETEAKDSSSENENEFENNILSEDLRESSNDPNFTQGIWSGKNKKKNSDTSERRGKGSSRQPIQSILSQNEVPNEEELKKFITAKCKKIPDPTPINNVKKEKDKPFRKQTKTSNCKTNKNTKLRRTNLEWLGATTDNTKVSDSSPVLQLASYTTYNNTSLNLNKSSGTCEKESNEGIHVNKDSTPTDVPSLTDITNLNSKCFSLVFNHKNSKSCEINSKLLSPVSDNHFFSNSSQELLLNNSSPNECFNTRKIIENEINPEAFSSTMIELNEDTITKSHKKREEFLQLFEMKAQIHPKSEELTVNSSSSSIEKNSPEITKHGKVKRRFREDHKLKSIDSNYQSKKAIHVVQSMSETEYDRMNSDVNSTGNSTSDGDDICSSEIKVKPDSENSKNIDINQEFSNRQYFKSCNVLTGVNDNNPVSGECINSDKFIGDDKIESLIDDPFLLWFKEIHTSGPLNGVSESVSCFIWEDDTLKKTNLSLLDIGWSIIQAVKRHGQDKSYSKIGFFTMIFLCFIPILFRMYANWNYLSKAIEMIRHTHLIDILLFRSNYLIKYFMLSNNKSLAVQETKLNISQYRTYSWSEDIIPLTVTSIVGSEWSIRVVIIFGVFLRIVLYSMTFIMLCVAENCFEQRLQYAKHFCRLTSSRRARKYYLPHFRLNKLANIKCWLSLRSYLKKRGPQRSVDSIISCAFYLLLTMLSVICINLLNNGNAFFVNKLINWDLTLCSLALGMFMMRFLVLGTQITKKYRNLSVIITEQINLFLAMQTRPHKKDELTLAHNVLRLAESLLKEIEGPFRICGWSMNPILYNVLKIVILSVFSTVFSETCGFKMKLYKIKINPSNW